MDAAYPPHAPRPWHHWRWVLLGAAVLALWIAVGYRFYFRDEPPPRDADLTFSVVRIPDRVNGLAQIRRLPEAPFNFAAFAKAHGVLDEVKIAQIEHNDIRADALIDAFLVQAQPALAQLDAALALAHFANSGLITYQTALPNVSLVLNAAKTIQLSARRHLQVHDYAAATRDILRLRLLAARLTEDHAVLIDYLLAHAVFDYAVKTTRDALNDPALPARQQRLLAQSVTTFPPPTAALQRSLQAEYQFVVSALAAEKDGQATFAAYQPSGRVLPRVLELWRRLSLQPNTTRRLVAEHFRAWCSALNIPYCPANLPVLDDPALTGFPDSPGLIPRLSYYLAPNYGGRYILRTLASTLSDVVTNAYTAVASDRLLRLGFVLRQYYDDHGTLPATLAELVPDYLPATLTDPFGGSPLRYNPARGIVYSVGINLKDNGGFSSNGDSAHSYADPLTDPLQPTLALTFQYAKK